MDKLAQRRGAAADLVRTGMPQAQVDALMVRSNTQAAWHLLGHGLALAAAGWLVALSRGHWTVWPAMFLMGIVMTHLFAPQHECAHFSAFRSRWLNRVVAWWCGAVIVSMPPSTSRSICRPVLAIILAIASILRSWLVMKLCPPKPGFTLITSTRSTSSIR